MPIARITVLTGLVAAATLAGCASTPGNDAIAGTWQGRADDSRPFTFGSVTFAGDGTYTAEAKYGDTTRVQTGRFVVTDDGLVLDDSRTYDLTFEEDSVVFTDPTSGNAMTLDRYR